MHTAEALIIDELHALIDTKRGAHLMLSIARLEKLCKRKLQRIGLSATIEPLQTAADYLSLDTVSMIAPSMQKQIHIEVNGLTPAQKVFMQNAWKAEVSSHFQRDADMLKSWPIM